MKTITSKTLLKVKTSIPSMSTEDILEAVRDLIAIKERFPSMSTADIIAIARTLPDDLTAEGV